MLRYATAERMLARMFDASDKVRVGALRGRLKRLKTLGVPLDSNPGKGAKVWYDEAHMYQWALCLQLEEAGLDPVVAAAFVRDEWAALWSKIKSAMLGGKPNAVLCIAPRLMSGSWGGRPRLTYQWNVTRLPRLAILIDVGDLVRDMQTTRVLIDTATPKGKE